MPRYFFDTSALVKQYHAEIGTPAVRRLLTEPGAECVISRIATVEMLSGFAGNVGYTALHSTKPENNDALRDAAVERRAVVNGRVRWRGIPNLPARL